MYSVLFWVPRSWWSTSKYRLISILLISTVVGMYLLGLGFVSTLLLWPLIYLLAISPLKFILTTSIQALVTIAVISGVLWINNIPNGTSFQPFVSFTILSWVYIIGRILSFLKETQQTSQEQFLELEQVHEELKATHAELQIATLQSMQYAALTERTRIAREIHDGLGHQMTSLIVQLQALELMLENDPKAAKTTVWQLLKIARLGMEEIRTSVHEWENDEKDLGIIALRGCISQMASHSEIQFHFKEEGEFSEWSKNISTTMFRILQEALTNVVRHSGANEIEICIREHDNSLSLIISDNGQFTNKHSLQNGFGIRGMIERCQSIGGTCTFVTNEQGGLTVTANIPI
ncbi:sensor histidine kinase [Bacillus wiedmannii]|uniref:sensor histidine kinase n=1 Tax=Bacillus wiedmannii TaxID=1890302 RepID=UPI001C54E510|nr:sensor histidine kinase [Bacillus wiedmannii]